MNQDAEEERRGGKAREGKSSHKQQWSQPTQTWQKASNWGNRTKGCTEFVKVRRRRKYCAWVEKERVTQELGKGGGVENCSEHWACHTANNNLPQGLV